MQSLPISIPIAKKNLEEIYLSLFGIKKEFPQRKIRQILLLLQLQLKEKLDEGVVCSYFNYVLLYLKSSVNVVPYSSMIFSPKYIPFFIKQRVNDGATILAKEYVNKYKIIPYFVYLYINSIKNKDTYLGFPIVCMLKGPLLDSAFFFVKLFLNSPCARYYPSTGYIIERVLFSYLAIYTATLESKKELKISILALRKINVLRKSKAKRDKSKFWLKKHFSKALVQREFARVQGVLLLFKEIVFLSGLIDSGDTFKAQELMEFIIKRKVNDNFIKEIQEAMTLFDKYGAGLLFTRGIRATLWRKI